MYSFDIFDTLITRTTATPRGIFALMKKQLFREKNIHKLEKYVVDNFFELRIHSEELARKSKAMQNVEEVSLMDIYEAMALCGCISHEQKNYLWQLEQQLEIENVIGIPENISKVKELLSKNEKIVLISDMYLPVETIRKMLIKVEDIFEKIPIYVSSEYLKRKTTGNIYRKVQELEQVEYEDWVHMGDNRHQDGEVPYGMGIQTDICARNSLTNFEEKILFTFEDDYRLQLMIGAAVRGNFEENSTDAYRIGYRYAGPVLYSYAEWIIDQAIKNGIKRLYFIARDGYLVKRIVDTILNKTKSNITTKYIYGSRKAWRMTSLSKENYNLYQLVLWSHVRRIKTLEQLADVLMVSLHDLYEYLPGVYHLKRDDTKITEQELEYIVDKLAQNNLFKRFHLTYLEEKKKLVQKYLRQEVDITDDKFAFVDVSGGGLTQGCLRELLKEMYSKPIHTFFFKIDRVNLVESSITDTFMPGFLENNLTIEMMCRAPHGQTKGYKECEGRVLPDLENVESQALIEHGFYKYEEGILDFSEKMCEVAIKRQERIGTIRNVLLYLKHIAEEPSKDVLEFFASMPSSESGRGDEVIEYAPKLTQKDIKDIFLLRTTEPIEEYYKGTDLNYSLMRGTKEDRMLAEQCRRECNSIAAKMYRQEKEREWTALQKKYCRAASYPVRLLEKQVILYGAGKFGQDLYNRLTTDNEHEVVLWVDKNAVRCRENGLSQVKDISKIDKLSQIPIVIAVLKKEIADEISMELINRGIEKQRIVWIPVFHHLKPEGKWKIEQIG